MMTTTCEYGRVLGGNEATGARPPPPPEPGGVVTLAAPDRPDVLPVPSNASTVYE